MTNLLILDVDGTLIQEEGIDLLAAQVKDPAIAQKVSKITQRAMNGEIDFKEALIERVATLKGLDDSCFITAMLNMHFNEGVEDLIDNLKAKRDDKGEPNWYVGLASGGFTRTVSVVAKSIGADFFIANKLEVIDEKLTGKIAENSVIIDKNVKMNFLISKAKELNIPIENTVAIGDGMNDLLMMKSAGRGFAYNAKPALLKEIADIEHIQAISDFSQLNLD